MLFHSHEFLALLAVTLVLFNVAPLHARPLILLSASMLFYAWAGIGMFALFLTVSAVAYVSLRRIEAGLAAGTGGKTSAAIGVSAILANLILFKYSVFALDAVAPYLAVAPARDWVAREIILPVGISFYSFQLIAVLIDAARGQQLGVRSFKELLLFIMFFGHLIAGPIMRGREFFPQLHVLRGPSIAQVQTGVLLLLVGLIKKVIFADELLAGRVDAMFAASAGLSLPSAWLAAALFGFQIYFDFSGYVDMALGMSKLFGLELMPNFSTPFISHTPSEFWSRWNITLSRWFGDYVYIPLGGSRGSIAFTIRNLLSTMALSGLWHGAGWTFLIWGLIHGLALAAYHALRHATPSTAEAMAHGRLQWLGWILTYAITTVAWVYFRAPSVAIANTIVATMFGAAPAASPMVIPVSDYLLVASLLILHRGEAWWIANLDSVAARVGERWMRLPGPVQALAAFPVLFVIVAITKVVRGAFIYFQF